MLVIRKEQMDALGLTSEKLFIDSLVRRFAVEFPLHQATLGDVGLKRVIESSLDWGRSRGLRTSGALTTVAELVLVYGPELQDSPDRDWAFELLENPTLPEELKGQLLRKRMDAKSKGRMLMRVAVDNGGEEVKR